MFELKKLAPGSTGRALRKVERYRLLNEPWEAESICRDVLELDPENQQAIVALLLSVTDQFRRDLTRAGEARSLLGRLDDEYQRLYYAGIIAERLGKAHLNRNAMGAAPIAYGLLREAMEWYDQAGRVRPTDNDDALLRWNTCARLLMRHPHLQPAPEVAVPTMLE